MKSILMSIRPQHVANILNKIKTLEIRKRFPRGYVGWVYIYCTKDKQLTLRDERYILIKGEKYHIDSPILNGKVVARFWCDKVETICKPSYNVNLPYYVNEEKVCKKSCLHFIELRKYLKGENGKAIHITNLEIFDKPKEISEFKYVCPNVLCDQCKYGSKEIDLALPICKRQLTRAPQSWCYIEV